MDPFNDARTELQSLSCWLTANESINCDEAEEFGRKIQSQVYNVKFSKSSIKRSDQVVSLASMKNNVDNENKKVNIDTEKLYSRLLIISQ